jgi:small redox-active disulfide protein 2
VISERRPDINEIQTFGLQHKRKNNKGVAMDIKVLGPGCTKCEKTEKIVQEAVAESGVNASVEKVTDVMEIAGYGVFGTPAVVVDGEVKSVGKVPTKADVLGWIH